MPRVFDRRPRALDDHNPLKNQLNYEDTEAYTRRAGQQIHEGIFSDAAKSHAGLLQQVFKIQDIIEALSGVEDGDTSDLGSAWIQHRADVRANIDNAVQSFFGWIGNGWSREDSEQAFADQAATTAALSAAVTALQNNYTNSTNGGLSAFIDFSLRSNSSSLGSDFTQTYTGSGSGTLGITNQKAVWQEVNDNDRACRARYNAVASSSDYQMVGAAFASAPTWFNSSSEARNFLYGRMDSTGNTYVYADFGKNDVELGCVVSGVKTVFATRSSGFSFQANSMYWLRCGTLGGQRVFQVLNGTTPIITYTEVGTTSQLGSGYRYTGFGVSARASRLGTVPPGSLLAFGFADNLPPVIVGSIASMYRVNTSGVSMLNGNNLLPTGFFDTPELNTEDYTYNLSNGSFTVANAGNYRCTIQSAISASFPNQFTWRIYVNGVAGKYGGDPHIRGVGALGGNETPNYAGGSVDIPLQAGDTVRWGYNSSGISADVLKGEATGSATYFTITMINRSLA